MAAAYQRQRSAPTLLPVKTAGPPPWHEAPPASCARRRPKRCRWPERWQQRWAAAASGGAPRPTSGNGCRKGLQPGSQRSFPGFDHPLPHSLRIHQAELVTRVLRAEL